MNIINAIIDEAEEKTECEYFGPDLNSEKL
jgi:hypothetical protein